MISENKKSTSKFHTFMEKAGWTIISSVVVFAITAWLGKVLILNFNWLMLGLVCIQSVITTFFVWYCIRTRHQLEKHYQAEIADLRKEYIAFKVGLMERFNQEVTHWNEWAANYSQANAKEQAKALEALRNEYKQHSAELRAELLGTAKSYFDHTTDWQHLHVENSHRLIEQTCVSELRSIRQLLKDAGIDRPIEESLTKK